MEFCMGTEDNTSTTGQWEEKKDSETQQLCENIQKFRRLKGLSQYFLTNKITHKDKQKAIFLTICGSKS